MPRSARIVAAGYPHHVTQRGNNRQDVFFVDDDRRMYLEILRRESEKHGVLVLGYCLMTNHVHLIVTPTTPDSLAAAVGRTHFRYTQYINRYHARSGHLWQNRFYSCILGESHFWSAMKYVERNPVRAKIAGKTWRYEWSSATAHVGMKEETDLPELDFWKKNMPGERWREKLVERDDAETVRLLKTMTSTGRPLGSDSFISKLESKLGRRLRPLPAGRPRKGENR